MEKIKNLLVSIVSATLFVNIFFCIYEFVLMHKDVSEKEYVLNKLPFLVNCQFWISIIGGTISIALFIAYLITRKKKTIKD